MAPAPPQVVDDGSRKLANYGYCLLVLLASPVLLMEQYEPEYKHYYFSPLECSCMGLIQLSPSLKPMAQALYLPATYLKRASKVLRQCYVKEGTGCSWAPLTEVAGLLQEADLSNMLRDFQMAFKPSLLQLMFMGGHIVTFAALVGFMRPVRLGTLGLILLTYACYATESVSLMPSLILLSTLGAYILFFDPKAFAGKPAGKAGRKQSGAAKVNTDGVVQPAAQLAPAQAKKASRRDVKKLYDI